MNTLIINGSPRKNGNTMDLINLLCNNLNGDIKLINTYYENILPCIDCRYCYTHNSCAINDEMKNIYNDIHTSDNIVIASPLYFNELTGKLLDFASRLQFLYVSKYIRKNFIFQDKKKKGALIIVGGGSSKNTTCAETTGKIILNEMNADLITTIGYVSTDNIKAIDDINTIKKVKEMSKILNDSK